MATRVDIEHAMAAVKPERYREARQLAEAALGRAVVTEDGDRKQHRAPAEVDATPELSALQQSFLARSIALVARLTDRLNEETLGQALAAPSDYHLLLRLVERPEVLALLQASESAAPARLRGLRAREELLAAEGGTASVDEVAEFLHLTRQAVEKRRRAGRLLALSLGRRGYAYPTWQFDPAGPHGVLPGLEAVLGELQTNAHDGWGHLIFFLSPNVRLDGETPLALLRRGDATALAAVRNAARMYGEHGAA